MRAKKEYSLVALGHLISRVESFVNGEESPANRFILLNKSVKYLNLRSLKKAIVDKWDPGFKNAYMKLYPDSPKAALRMLYGSVFKRVEFFSSADVIVIRANISLFYLAKGIRIKLFMPGGVRSLVEFKNEIDIRKKIESSELIHVPRLLSSNLESEPFFFADEIIYGDLLSSDNPQTPSVFKMIIPRIWQFYQSNGIDWLTLKEKGIDLKDKIEAYKSAIDKGKRQGPELDLDRIETFGDRLIPNSLIHGDLSIKNILVTSNKNYLTDWETSRRDFIIFDFLRILLNKKWQLHDDIDRLMCLEIENRFGSDKKAVLSLSEQIMLAYFLRKTEQLTNTDRFTPH